MAIEVNAQRDSILNKTWVANFGDVFRFSIDTNHSNKLNFRLNYKYDKDMFTPTLSDTSFIIFPNNNTNPDDYLVLYKYNYQNDSILLEKIGDDYAYLKNGSLEIDNKTSYGYIKKGLIFYDSTYYFKNIRHFKVIEISDPFRKIILDSIGNLEVNYQNNFANNTTNYGLYKGKIESYKIGKVNKLLHLAQFELWERLLFGCSSSHGFKTEKYQITYQDTVYNKSYMGNCKNLPMYEFAHYVFKLAKDMKYTDSSDIHLFNSLPNRNEYKLVYGKSQLISEYANFYDKSFFLYKVLPDSFYSTTDSLKVAYFSSDTLIDSNKVMLYALKNEPLKSKKLKTPFEDYYILKRTYWAPQKRWLFKSPKHNDRAEISRKRLVGYKQFLFIKYRPDPNKELIKNLKKHVLKNK